MRLVYNEEGARLTVKEGERVWRYRDVPLSVWWRVRKLWRLGFEGSVWQIVKRYPEIKE